MKTPGLVFLCFILSFTCSYGQSIITTDLDHFWEAYDSIRTTTDSLKQIHYLQKLYIDRGTPGLKAFMEARNYTVDLWVSLIRRYPKFWNSIRPATLKLKTKANEFRPAVAKLKALYPSLPPATIYIMIGALRSGGTASGDKVLIGAELAGGGPGTDVSEFPPDTRSWLENYFRNDPAKDVVFVNIHEYVHTLQKGNPLSLLGLAIQEGTCDFVTHKALGKMLSQSYVSYGRANEAMLKEEFKLEMYTDVWRYWLYNTTMLRHGVRDLGYFMGYTICAAYYNQASDKKQAIRDIIELDYSNEQTIEAFLAQSGYYPAGTVNKADMLALYEAKKPYGTGTSVIINGDTLVDHSLTTIRVHFSEPMNTRYVSMELGEGGREHYPIVNRIGFSDDGMSVAFNVALKPDYAYSFILSGGGFRSAAGYPLKDYIVTFRTRK